MGSPRSAADTAFQTALRLYRAQHPNDSQATSWLRAKHTQSDVQRTIEQARAKYEGRAQGKIRRWLANLSTGILGYGKVMDVLAQHHPEYVSLAWGTTKLLFILFQNHDELITELAKSMSEIADILPRVDQYMDLYNDSILQSKIEHLFVFIIGHFDAMLKFYQEGRLKHAWKAFIQPYSIRFKSLKQEIDVCSRSVEQYVSVKLHVVLADLRKEQSAVGVKVSVLETITKDQSTKVDLICTLLCQIQANTALLPSMSLTLQETQLADMITHTTDTRLLRPMDSLQAWFALCNRQKLHQNVALQNVWSSGELKQWSMSPEAAIIVIQGSAPTQKQTYAFGTYMTRFIQQSKIAVLWALPAVSSAHCSMTWTGLLRYLTTQALQLNGTNLCNALPKDLSILKVATAFSEADYEQILISALQSINLVYIIIDINMLENDLLAPGNIAEIHQSIERITTKAAASNVTLKLAFLNSRRTTQFAPSRAHTLALDAFGRKTRYQKPAANVRRGHIQVPLVFRQKRVR